MITATVLLDVSDEVTDSHALSTLGAVPSGARVCLFVGDRLFVPQRTCHWLAEASERLDLDVQGTPRAVSVWVRELRAFASARGAA